MEPRRVTLHELPKNILGTFVDVCTTRIIRKVCSERNLKKRDFPEYKSGNEWVFGVPVRFWF